MWDLGPQGLSSWSPPALPASVHPHSTRHPPASGSWCGLTSLAWVLATSTHGSQTNEPGRQHSKLRCCQRHHGCSRRTRWTPDGPGQDKEIITALPPGWDSSCVPIISASHAGCSRPHGTEHRPYPKAFLSRQNFSRQPVFHYIEELLCLMSNANIAN